MNNQKRRMLTACLALLLLIPVVCLPVAAISFPGDGDDEFGSDSQYEFMWECAETGYYQLTFNDYDGISYTSTQPFYLTRLIAGDALVIPVELTGGNVTDVVNIDITCQGTSDTFVLASGYWGNGIDIDSVILSEADISVDSNETSSGFIASVELSLDVVIDWVGKVVNALVTGPLTPLLAVLAVPISVTALVFSIKAIRRTSWGA